MSNTPASFSGTHLGGGWGTTRGANCDACVWRTQCAGALGGNSTVSGSAVLFLVNEAAEQVGDSVRAGPRRVGVEREVRGRGGEGDGPSPSCGPGSAGQLSRAYWFSVLVPRRRTGLRGMACLRRRLKLLDGTLGWGFGLLVQIQVNGWDIKHVTFSLYFKSIKTFIPTP